MDNLGSGGDYIYPCKEATAKWHWRQAAGLAERSGSRFTNLAV